MKVRRAQSGSEAATAVSGMAVTVETAREG